MRNNTMSIDGKQLHVKTRFRRPYLNTKSKLMKHNDAAFKKAERVVTVRPRTHSDLIPWAQKIEFESCK